jgi:hypothetical protein
MDFLNGIVREKKHFESTFDDSVVAGWNAGTEVLMNQVRILLVFPLSDYLNVLQVANSDPCTCILPTRRRVLGPRPNMWLH